MDFKRGLPLTAEQVVAVDGGAGCRAGVDGDMSAAPHVRVSTTRLRDNHEQRFAEAYEDLQRPSRAMIRRAFGAAFSEDEIEDLYGSAWAGTLRALRGREEALEDSELRSYVLTAVANHASRELRRRGRRPTSPLDEAGERADDSPALDDLISRGEQSAIARDVLASMSQRRRAILVYRYGLGLEPAEIQARIEGLSSRTYRKEIEKGTKELARKLAMVEAGEWCRDREPLLQAMVSGLASEDERRAATLHLGHCRHCSQFVARLSNGLHELGGGAVIAAAFGAAGNQESSGRIGIAVDGIRDAVAGTARHGAETLEAASPALAGSGTRGAGVAGAGLLAKLATIGTAGKVALVCLGTGVAATACVAGGVIPSLADVGKAPAKVTKSPDAKRPPARTAPSRKTVVDDLPGPAAIATEATFVETAPPDGYEDAEVVPVPPPVEPSTTDTSTSTTPPSTTPEPTEPVIEEEATPAPIPAPPAETEFAPAPSEPEPAPLNEDSSGPGDVAEPPPPTEFGPRLMTSD